MCRVLARWFMLVILRANPLESQTPDAREKSWRPDVPLNVLRDSGGSHGLSHTVLPRSKAVPNVKLGHTVGACHAATVRAFAPPVDQITTVNIGLGFSDTLADSLGANVPGIALWDQIGRAIGATVGTSHVVGQGNTIPVTITPNATIGNVQPEYMSVTNGGDDAILVAFITVTFPASNGQSSFAGDVGKACSFDWFPSSQLFGSDGFTPTCVWIDRNDSNDHKYQGFGVHLPDFFNVPGKGDEYNHSIDTMCSSGPRFRMYEKLKTSDPILFFDPPINVNADISDADPSKVINNPGKFTGPQWGLFAVNCGTREGESLPQCQNQKRAIKPGSGVSSSSSVFMEGQLVVSAFQHHSAQEVCSSQISRGPDIVSTQEGIHCDMATLVVSNVCSESITTCCFDTTVNTMRPCGVIRGSTQAIEGSVKQYHKIHQWAPPSTSTDESPR